MTRIRCPSSFRSPKIPTTIRRQPFPDDRLLSSLPSRLDRGQLFERFRIALQSGLQALIWDDAYPLVDRDVA